MKQVKLSSLKDNAKFKLSTEKEAAVYEVVRKEKARVIYSSTVSKRTYSGLNSRMVYPVNY